MPYPDITCTHAASGLCPACQAEYDEDPSSYLEFGSHPQGLKNWADLQAEMATERAREAALPAAEHDEGEIPF